MKAEKHIYVLNSGIHHLSLAIAKIYPFFVKSTMSSY